MEWRCNGEGKRIGMWWRCSGKGNEEVQRGGCIMEWSCRGATWRRGWSDGKGGAGQV